MYAIVVGCGRVGSQLAIFLAAEGHDVVVIDKDERSFRRLGTTFNGITLEGVGFDEAILREAGAEKAEALAAVTNLDNTNLMTAEVAKRFFNIPRVVTRLYNPEKEASYQQFGVDYVCGTTLVATRILDKIIEGRVSHYSFRDSEITEFEVTDALAKRKVSDIEAPGEMRVVLIKRSKSDVIPLPDTLLRGGDKIVAVVKRQSIPKLKKFIKK